MIIDSSEVVDLDTPTGKMRTYILKPVGDGKYPGIVLYSEIFQVTGPVRRIAQFLAGHGYVVAIPEVYHELFDEPSVVLKYTPEDTAIGNAHKISKELGSYDADNRAALDFLATHPSCNGALGTFGFCLGGILALRGAMNPDVKAGVCFYATDIHSRSLGKGTNDNTIDRLGDIPGELMMVFGRQDPHVPLEGRREIQGALDAAGTNYSWYEVNGQHAFLRDEGARYDAELFSGLIGLALDLYHRALR